MQTCNVQISTYTHLFYCKKQILSWKAVEMSVLSIDLSSLFCACYHTPFYYSPSAFNVSLKIHHLIPYVKGGSNWILILSHSYNSLSSIEMETEKFFRLPYYPAAISPPVT